MCLVHYYRYTIGSYVHTPKMIKLFPYSCLHLGWNFFQSMQNFISVDLSIDAIHNRCLESRVIPWSPAKFSQILRLLRTDAQPYPGPLIIAEWTIINGVVYCGMLGLCLNIEYNLMMLKQKDDYFLCRKTALHCWYCR